MFVRTFGELGWFLTGQNESEGLRHLHTEVFAENCNNTTSYQLIFIGFWGTLHAEHLTPFFFKGLQDTMKELGKEALTTASWLYLSNCHMYISVDDGGISIFISEFFSLHLTRVIDRCSLGMIYNLLTITDLEKDCLFDRNFGCVVLYLHSYGKDHFAASCIYFFQNWHHLNAWIICWIPQTENLILKW